MSLATTPTYRHNSSDPTWHSARASPSSRTSESKRCKRSVYTSRRRLSRNGWIHFWSRLVGERVKQTKAHRVFGVLFVSPSADDGQLNLFSPLFFAFVLQAKMEVEDLFVDLADGVKLLKLLEIISGEKLGKPNNGRMRVHKIENLNKSLAFLHTKVSSLRLHTLRESSKWQSGEWIFFCFERHKNVLKFWAHIDRF